MANWTKTGQLDQRRKAFVQIERPELDKLDKNWTKTGQKLDENWTKTGQKLDKTGQKLDKNWTNAILGGSIEVPA